MSLFSLALSLPLLAGGPEQAPTPLYEMPQSDWLEVASHAQPSEPSFQVDPNAELSLPADSLLTQKQTPCFWWSESAMDFVPLACTSLFDSYVRPGYLPRKDPAPATSVATLKN